MSNEARIPQVPLASFYFFYFAVLGGFMPYWGLYLQQLQFSPEAIGQLMGITAGAARVHPADLWNHDWRWRAVGADEAARPVQADTHAAHAEVVAALKARAALATFAAEVVTMSPEEFAQWQRRDRERYGAFIKAANIRAD